MKFSHLMGKISFFLKKNLGILGLLAAICSGIWAFGDKFGFRPALKSEVLEAKEQNYGKIIEISDKTSKEFTEIRQELEIVGRSLAWVQLENYEKKLQRQGLTRRECAAYRKLAAQLGIIPRSC